MAPDLVSICAAGNDLLRPSARPADLAHRLDEAVGRLRDSGAEVLVFTGFDTRATPVVDLVGRRLATMNEHIREIAARRGARLVDLWTMETLADPRTRAEDRLHLNPDGHRRVAARVCEVLGVPTDDDWRDPWPPADRPPWVRRREDDLRWARAHLVPWVGRRLQGRSTGDGRPPKRPEPAPVTGPECQRWHIADTRRQSGATLDPAPASAPPPDAAAPGAPAAAPSAPAATTRARTARPAATSARPARSPAPPPGRSPTA